MNQAAVKLLSIRCVALLCCISFSGNAQPIKKSLIYTLVNSDTIAINIPVIVAPQCITTNTVKLSGILNGRIYLQQYINRNWLEINSQQLVNVNLQKNMFQLQGGQYKLIIITNGTQVASFSYNTLQLNHQ